MSGVSLLSLPDIVHKMADGFGLYDDFVKFTAADLWTVTADAGETQDITDGAGGIMSIACDGDDNDEAYLISSHEIFKFAAGKPLVAEARLKFVEVDTDKANIIFGLMDAAGADALLDNGGGPAASYDGAVFFKVDGGTKWQVETSNAGTQTTDTLDQTAGGSSYQTLRIEAVPRDSESVEVSFWMDPSGGKDFKQCRQNGANPRTPDLKHTIALSGLEEMHLLLGVKAGSGATETLLADYVWAWQKR